MPIYRMEHKEKYFVLSNHVVNDETISFKAKGILAYLLSKPVDWKVIQEDIANHSTDGKASVRAGIKELMDAGYISRRQTRSGNGRILEWEYTVTEVPHTGFPQLEKQQVANGTLQSTDLTKYGSYQLRNNDDGLSTSAKHLTVSREFYHWYVAKCYPHYKQAKHPRLIKQQRENVLSALDSFIGETGVDLKGLGDMANQYFRTIKDCDHNINHFSTEGILQNRFYEVVF